MGYDQDTRTCAEHGFVLTPEGTCLRCLRENAHSGKRQRLIKVATGGLIIAVSLVVFRGALARMGSHSSAAGPVAVVATEAPVEPSVARSEPAPEEAAPLRSTTSTHDWDIALAHAEAQRAALATAQAAAEKQREEAALVVPVVADDRARGQGTAGEERSPLWRDGHVPLVYRRGHAGAAAAGTPYTSAGGLTNPSSPTAWNVMPPSGGSFRSTRASH